MDTNFSLIHEEMTTAMNFSITDEDSSYNRPAQDVSTTLLEDFGGIVSLDYQQDSRVVIASSKIGGIWFKSFR
jgi:hypothetical protein